ncbi:MAG: glycosyltransferase family 2 protein [Kiritimatiellae bacterium]|jgi:glycosyltransferase involved in cell wall biosynthesis|nr:glycosyltransferase family 2 protein [Kiritimatiellia bacterium]
MKLIIQIPCFNEEETLPITVAELPRDIPGIDTIEYLIIDDGSRDHTRKVAEECGVHHIVGFPGNRGLARAFQYGIDCCISLGADFIVNTDADNQYCGADIPKLLKPLLDGTADIVVGDRETQNISHFSLLKKFLQKQGSRVVGQLAGSSVPDATSGFRAFTRAAALELNITSNFSYTLETLIQAGRKNLTVAHVPIRTNGVLRPSRLFRSMPQFIKRSGGTMVRVYTTYQPLKVFLTASIVCLAPAMILFLRFLYYYFIVGEGGGRVQSLIIAVALTVFSAFLATIGILADMINTNRKLIEDILRSTRDTGDL